MRECLQDVARAGGNEAGGDAVAQGFGVRAWRVVFSGEVAAAVRQPDARGEADAGFVYRTDAVLQQSRLNIAATVPTVKPVSYPLAVVAASAHKAEAQRFVQYVLSANGQNVLRKYGFSKP